MITKRLKTIIGLIAIGCQLSIINSFAQNAGDIISGTVSDAFGPVIDDGQRDRD